MPITALPRTSRIARSMHISGLSALSPGRRASADEDACRKTRPRADQPAPFNSILRSGIPYGPECKLPPAVTSINLCSYPSFNPVTAAEISSSVSNPNLERGLAFVSYQSQISQGFRFMQQAWANDPNFVTGKNVAPGLSYYLLYNRPSIPKDFRLVQVTTQLLVVPTVDLASSPARTSQTRLPR